MTGFFSRSYREYLIETNKPFLHGEIAIANKNGDHFYLQYIPVQKLVTLQLIEQYLSLRQYTEVYTEGKALVFIQPYIEIIQAPTDERSVISWIKKKANGMWTK